MEIIDYKCKECGNDKSYKKILKNLEYGECTKCGKMTYNKMLSPSKSILVRCPYCHSTNTKKISTTSKVGSVALFGIFAAGKVAKEWHCNNCKSDF